MTALDPRVAAKFSEIRYQMKCNVEIIMRDYPDEKPAILPHEIEILSGHVEDRLKELEAIIGSQAQATGEVVVKEYRPCLIRNEEAKFVEFIEQDVPTVTGQMMALNVEPIYDLSTRSLIGYRVYDDALFDAALTPAASA